MLYNHFTLYQKLFTADLLSNTICPLFGLLRTMRSTVLAMMRTFAYFGVLCSIDCLVVTNDRFIGRRGATYCLHF